MYIQISGSFLPLIPLYRRVPFRAALFHPSGAYRTAAFSRARPGVDYRFPDVPIRALPPDPPVAAGGHVPRR